VKNVCDFVSRRESGKGVGWNVLIQILFVRKTGFFLFFFFFTLLKFGNISNCIDTQ